MLSSLSVYIAPLLVFGLVVFVHELGHFVAAKMCGVYAPVFSLGWGRRLFGWKRGETDYRVSLIPLGGYVRMASRDDDALSGIEGGEADRGSLDSAADAAADKVPGGLWDPQGMAPFGPKAVPADRWVESKSALARIFILSAGVIMNIVLTITVLSGLHLNYGNRYVPAVIDSVVVNAPAAQAGLQSGDRIVAIGGTPIKAWVEVQDRVTPVTSGSLAIEVQRGAERLSFSVTPQVAEGQDPVTGAMKPVGRIGVLVRDSVVRESLSIGEAIVLGSSRSWKMATDVVTVLGGLVSGEVSAKNLGGPIQIARTSVQAARNGAEMLWSLIAFLSLNIAVLNLVPIPVLEGGQILMVVAERIKGSEFSMRTREAFARVGVLAVLALILLVTFNDLRSVFTQ
jgi:regulator of sigma E protease